MILFHNKKHGVNFYECWYAEEPIRRKGIIRYNQSIEMFPDGFHWEKKRTLLSKLDLAEEDILKAFTKNNQYYIRRAIRENVITQHYWAEKLSAAHIEDFVSFYVSFCETKKLGHPSETELCTTLNNYREKRALSIHTASLEDKVVVYHVCLLLGDTVRLLYSASQYRTEDSHSAQIISAANRYLHYSEMLYAKENGKRTYDWGGAGLREEVKNITEFKESFGGKEAYYYNGVQTNGLMAKLFFKFVTKR